MVHLFPIRSARTCESHRKKQVKTSRGNPKGSRPRTGQVPAKLHAVTDGTTFASLGVYGGLGNLGRPSRISSAEKSVIIYCHLLDTEFEGITKTIAAWKHTFLGLVPPRLYRPSKANWPAWTGKSSLRYALLMNSFVTFSTLQGCSNSLETGS